MWGWEGSGVCSGHSWHESPPEDLSLKVLMEDSGKNVVSGVSPLRSHLIEQVPGPLHMNIVRGVLPGDTPMTGSPYWW